MLDFESLEVKNCCCCLTLRTGNKIIGFLSLTKSIVIYLYLISTFTVNEVRSGWRLVGIVTKYAFYSKTFHFVDVVTSFLLLLGVYQGKPEMMIWWLAFTLMSVVLQCLIPSFLIDQLQISIKSDPHHILTLLNLMYNVYVLLVVYSYYRTLVRRRQLSAPEERQSQVMETGT